jgi:hypothetical protein
MNKAKQIFEKIVIVDQENYVLVIKTTNKAFKRKT